MEKRVILLTEGFSGEAMAPLLTASKSLDTIGVVETRDELWAMLKAQKGLPTVSCHPDLLESIDQEVGGWTRVVSLNA